MERRKLPGTRLDHERPGKSYSGFGVHPENRRVAIEVFKARKYEA